MTMILKRCVWITTVSVGLGIGGCVVQAIGAPFQDRDYSKNKTYQQGVREGQVDRTNNKDHSKNRHFKKDEDQKAYEAGYQKGRGK